MTGHTDIRMKGKTICPPLLRGGGIKIHKHTTKAQKYICISNYFYKHNVFISRDISKLSPIIASKRFQACIINLCSYVRIYI